MKKLIEKVANQTLALSFAFSDEESQAKNKEAFRWNTWDWSIGVAFYGVWKAFDVVKDDAYAAQMKQWIDSRMEHDISRMCVNTSAPMTSVLRLNALNQETKYADLCAQFDDFICNKALRVPSGAIAHSVMHRDVVGEVWADTLFMSVLYLAKRAAIEGDSSLTNEAMKQLCLHVESLYDKVNGLFYHGWDDIEQKPLGVKWGRGNAWVTVSIVEMLELLPAVFAGKQELVNKLNYQLAALAVHQDASGLWHTVVDNHDTYLETSVTAGVAYGILKGIRLGYVDCKYKDMACKAIEALQNNIDADGNVGKGSTGTPIKEDAIAYNNIGYAVTPFTQGLVLMALSEYAEHWENVVSKSND